MIIDCPKCGSNDTARRLDEEEWYCFGCSNKWLPKTKQKENKTMMKNLSTAEVQDLIYKRRVEEKKWNKGLDFEEAVDEVNAKIDQSYIFLWHHKLERTIKLTKKARANSLR